MQEADFDFIVESTLIPHTAYANAATRLRQCYARAKRSPEPIFFAIVGESRTGKSRILEEFESENQPIRTAEGMTVPVLRISAAAKPSAKNLAEEMLQQLGDPRWDMGTEAQKTKRLKILLKGCGTRMLMIDEFQHFVDQSTHRVFHHVADWLKGLGDSTKAAIVVTGLNSCLPVLVRNEQLFGRFLAPAYMKRFHWLVDDDRAEFLGILEAFNESLSAHVKVPPLHEEEMAFRCWCATGGLIGYLSKMLRQLLWDAEDANRNSATLEDFDIALKRAIWITDPPEDEDKSPFVRTWMTSLTQDKIDRALAVGLKEEPQAETRKPRRRPSGKGRPVSELLTAT